MLTALLLMLSQAPDGGAEVQDVSMIQLLARPQEFDGKRVRLIGYFTVGFEESALFFHKEDFEFGNDSNAVWVNLSSPGATPALAIKIRRGWVLLEGIFDASDHGHMGAFPAGIRSVTRVVSWAPAKR